MKIPLGRLLGYFRLSISHVSVLVHSNVRLLTSTAKPHPEQKCVAAQQRNHMHLNVVGQCLVNKIWEQFKSFIFRTWLGVRGATK